MSSAGRVDGGLFGWRSPPFCLSSVGSCARWIWLLKGDRLGSQGRLARRFVVEEGGRGSLRRRHRRNALTVIRPKTITHHRTHPRLIVPNATPRHRDRQPTSQG